MKKRIFTSILIIFTALFGITAKDSSSPESIILLTQKAEIPYTISLNYDNEQLDSENIHGTGFDTDYQSGYFTIELSTGNIANATQYVITIEPGEFINYVAYNHATSTYTTYTLDFKPTPIPDITFISQTSEFDTSNKELTLTSKQVEAGYNTKQTIAKFSIGWIAQDFVNLSPLGSYVSTIVVKYTCNDL